MKDIDEIKNIEEILDIQLPIAKDVINYIREAIKEGNLEKAKKFGEQEAFKRNGIIQFQMLEIAIEEGNYDKAKEIGNIELFENNEFIQKEMIELAIKEGDYERARKIGSRIPFMENASIQELIKSIDEIEKKVFLNKIKTKLYYDKISKEDMEDILNNEKISDYERTCMLIAIYSKNNKIAKVKEVAKNYGNQSDDTKQKGTINRVVQKIEKNRGTIFDMGIFDKAIGWEFDEQLKNEYDLEIKEKQKEKDDMKTQKIKQKIARNIETFENSSKIRTPFSMSTHIEPMTTTTISPYYKTREANFKSNIKVPKNKLEAENKTKKATKERSYYVEIKDYLELKRREIYVEMQSTDLEKQRKAISYWDKMEILIEKLEKNKSDKEYLSTLYNKISQLKEKEKGVSR